MKQGHADKIVFRPKTDVHASGVNPGAVAQVGTVVGQNPVLPGMAANKDVHVKPAAEGPGGGRTIYGCGSQARHGE